MALAMKICGHNLRMLGARQSLKPALPRTAHKVLKLHKTADTWPDGLVTFERLWGRGQARIDPVLG
jgi:hypothetical protein